MNEQVTVTQVLQNIIRGLQMLQVEHNVSETYKETDGSIFQTIALSVTVDGKPIEVFKKTSLVDNPAQLKEQILAQEADLQTKLTAIQSTKDDVITELDKVIPIAEVAPDAKAEAIK